MSSADEVIVPTETTGTSECQTPEPAGFPAKEGLRDAGTCVEGTTTTGATDITIGHVLELLLSAAYLHKNTSSTISSLLGFRDGNAAAAAVDTKTNMASNAVNNNSCLNGPNKTGNSVPGIVSCAEAPKEPNIPAAEIWMRLLSNPATTQPERALKILQHIIQDGLLDSILPYVVSSLHLTSDFATNPFPEVTSSAYKAPVLPPSPVRKHSDNVNRRPANASIPEKEKQRDASKLQPRSTSRMAAESRRNSDDDDKDWVAGDTLEVKKPALGKAEKALNSLSETSSDKGPPIVIHVCDEAHGLRQDFTCPRDLLIAHIGYFADVTAGQRLEDVDISVHCDVSIFDWLLKWVKKHESPAAKEPVLDPKNAISILISADFLKMNPLAEEVLKYVHDNTNQILEAQVNLSCFTEALLTRLSRMFTHWELENLKDTRDRLQNKLYARFVQNLCEVHSQPTRGIFRTAATIYKCCDCGKIVSKSIEKMTDCIPANTYVTTSGSYYYVHSRDITWTLTEHVRQTKNELKSWRLVYWRLWGQVHFLPCSTCGTVFPGTEMKLCRQHRMEPPFGIETLNSSASSVAAGDAYPCCSARALRFSPLPIRNGCQFGEHTVQLTRRNIDVWGPIPQIYDDLLSFQVLICTEPSTEGQSQQKVLWKGVPIVPPARHEKSFLDRSWLGEHRDKGTPGTTETESSSVTSPKACEEPVEAPEEEVHKVLSDGEDESSDDEEEGTTKKKRLVAPKLRTALFRKAAKAKKTIAYEICSDPGWRWDTTRSTRHNQDAQRDRETKIFRELTAWLSLTPPVAAETAVGPRNRGGRPDRKKEYFANAPDPGFYYRLEVEFKEKLASQDRNNHSNSGGIFRAKVQAISRIKMRLRHRAAFSANR